jgi:hypothetical protein
MEGRFGMGRAARLLSLLADERLAKVAGWVAVHGRLADSDLDTCAAAIDIERRWLDRVLVKLASAGLLRRQDHAFTMDYARLAKAVELLDEGDPLTARLQADHAALQGFFVHGELVELPAKPAKLAALADLLKHLFEPKHEYPEQLVNNMLMQVNDDYVTLRRLLVDYRKLERTPDGQTYWRTAD